MTTKCPRCGSTEQGVNASTFIADHGMCRNCHKQWQFGELEKENTVYVVAWEYNGGGGFDWYFTEETANKAFEAEKANCNDPELAKENWTAARYDFSTDFDPNTQREEITAEIDENSVDLFDNAPIKYKGRREG